MVPATACEPDAEISEISETVSPLKQLEMHIEKYKASELCLPTMVHTEEPEAGAPVPESCSFKLSESLEEVHGLPDLQIFSGMGDLLDTELSLMGMPGGSTGDIFNDLVLDL